MVCTNIARRFKVLADIEHSKSCQSIRIKIITSWDIIFSRKREQREFQFVIQFGAYVIKGA